MSFAMANPRSNDPRICLHMNRIHMYFYWIYRIVNKFWMVVPLVTVAEHFVFHWFLSGVEIKTVRSHLQKIVHEPVQFDRQHRVFARLMCFFCEMPHVCISVKYWKLPIHCSNLINPSREKKNVSIYKYYRNTVFLYRIYVNETEDLNQLSIENFAFAQQKRRYRTAKATSAEQWNGM